MKTKTGFAWFGLIIAVAILAVAGWLVIKQPNFSGNPPPIDLAGWKTYRNEGYGVEFKYGENWKIVSPNSENAIVSLRNSTLSDGDEIEIIRGNHWSTEEPSGKILDREIVVGDIGAYDSDWVEFELGFIRNINFVAPRQFMLNFFFTSSEDKKLADQILATFRFTK